MWKRADYGYFDRGRKPAQCIVEIFNRIEFLHVQHKQDTGRPDSIDTQQKPAGNRQTIVRNVAVDRDDALMERTMNKLMVRMGAEINSILDRIDCVNSVIMPTDPENERVTDTELNECDEKF
jgi:hypothetical protein